MASYTPNINLKKPADGDAYDIADANGNMDAIDTAIGSLRESVSQTITGSNVKTGSVSYVMRANVVTVTVNISALNSTPSASTSYVVGALPAGARPGGNVFTALFQLDTPVGNIYINEGGNVMLRITGTPSASALYRGNSTFVAVN